MPGSPLLIEATLDHPDSVAAPPSSPAASGDAKGVVPRRRPSSARGSRDGPRPAWGIQYKGGGAAASPSRAVYRLG